MAQFVEYMQILGNFSQTFVIFRGRYIPIDKMQFDTTILCMYETFVEKLISTTSNSNFLQQSFDCPNVQELATF